MSDIFKAYLSKGLQDDKPEPMVEQEEQRTFQQELEDLINRHSMENPSGTPDWILANFLARVLEQFDCAIMARATWRGESTELPALQRLEQDSQAVEKTYEHIRILARLGVITFDENLKQTDLYRIIKDEEV